MSGNYLSGDQDAAFKAETRKQRGQFAPCKPTPAEEDRITEARAALLWQQPFFAHILIDKLEIITTDDSESCQTAATDGDTIFINPKTFCKHTVAERVFILAHEIAHCIWDHCGMSYRFSKLGYVPVSPTKNLPYDGTTMNVVEDYVINAMLVDAKVGAFNKSWLLDPAVKGDHSVIDTYALKYKKQQGQGGGGGSNPGSGHGGFDQHLAPGTGKGKDPFDATQGRDAQEWATSVAQAAAAARAQGKMPASLDRMVGEIITPAVDWKEHIQGFLSRRIGGGSYDWKRPDRRLLMRREPIVVPGRSGNGVGKLVMGMDTSGSVNQETVGLWLGTLAGMLADLNPEVVYVIWCDARVHRVDEVDDPGDIEWLRCQGAPGGGGTKFIPVFEQVEKLGITPDALIYLTDGYGTFPKEEPRYPVLWGMTTDVVPPFGEIVRLPEL